MSGAWWHFWLCGWRSACGRKKTRYRAIPGTPGQFNLLVRRAGVKWVRNWGIKFLDVCLFAGAALIIGALFTLISCNKRPKIYVDPGLPCFPSACLKSNAIQIGLS